MMQILGHIFVSILVAIIIIVGDYYLPGSFLTSFIDNHFIETFATIVGLNITAVVFLLGQLIVVKEKLTNSRNVFENTIKQIKHSSYFLVISFLLSLVVLIFRPNLKLDDVRLGVNVVYYIMNGSLVMLFCLSVVSIFEILGAVFKLSKV